MTTLSTRQGGTLEFMEPSSLLFWEWRIHTKLTLTKVRDFPREAIFMTLAGQNALTVKSHSCKTLVGAHYIQSHTDYIQATG